MRGGVLALFIVIMKTDALKINPDAIFFPNSDLTSSSSGECWTDIPDEVRCSNMTSAEFIICLCRFNCREVKLKCGESISWIQSQCNVSGTVLEEKGARVIAEITNLTYSYSCAPGHVMLRPGSASCKDGLLRNNTLPLCVRERPGKRIETYYTTETTISKSSLNLITPSSTTVFPVLNNSTLESHVPDMKTMYIILIVMIGVLAVFALMTLLVISWCKKAGLVPRESEKTRLNRQSRVKSLNLI